MLLRRERSGVHQATLVTSRVRRIRHECILGACMSGFVGRQDDLAWLRATARQRGQVVVVAGEAGIGKTRLLAEALTADSRSATVAFPSAAVPASAHGLRSLALQAKQAGAALLDNIGVAAPDAVCEAATALVAAFDDRPVVFDDVQWADEMTLNWIASLGDAVTAPIVLAVRTVHDVPLSLGEALTQLAGRVSVRLLQPLEPEDLLVFARGRGYVLDEPTAYSLRLQSGGNPLMAEALLAQWSRSPASSASLPSTPEAVQASLQQLSAECRRLLSHTAICGAPVPEWVVQESTQLTDEEMDSAVAEATTASVLCWGADGTLLFTHELRRDWVLQLDTIEQRRRIGRRLASALSNMPQPPSGQIAALLSESGDAVKAAEWYGRAASEAMSAHDYHAVLARAESAIRLCRGTDVEVLRTLILLAVEAGRLLCDPERAARMLDAVSRHVSDASVQGELLIGRARLVSFRGDYAARAQLLTHAEERFRSAGDARRSRVLAELAFPVGSTLTIAQRRAVCDEAVELARADQESETLSLAFATRALLRAYLGDVECFGDWDSAKAVLPGGDVWMRRRNDLNRLSAAVLLGDYEEARRLVATAEMAAASEPEQGIADMFMALIAWRTGRWGVAHERARRVASVSVPNAVRAVANVVELAIHFEGAGRPEVAQLADVAVGVATNELEHTNLLAVALTVHSALRQPRRLALIGGVLRRAVDGGYLVGWEDLLPAAVAVGGEAMDMVDRATEDSAPAGPRASPALLHRNGLRCARRGDMRAVDLLDAAADGYRSLGEPFPAATATAVAAGLLVKSGRRAGGRWQSAAEAFADLGADRSLAELLRAAAGSRSLSGVAVPKSQHRVLSPGLTPREAQVAELARHAFTAPEIAARLGIATGTVRVHLERIKSKVGAASKMELVRLLNE